MPNAKQWITSILEKVQLTDLMEDDVVDSIYHGELVGMLVKRLCTQLGYPEGFQEQMLVAAYVHDIGKLRLSKNLYGRDKKALHVEEVKYMRMHTELGREMLGQCGYPSEILNAVYYHHENYDGTGYPKNLKAEKIPLEARILRVCDVFAALISDRPYRRGFDVNTAMELMIEDVKTFDMKIFLEFMNVFHSDGFKEVIDFANQINENKRSMDETGNS